MSDLEYKLPVDPETECCACGAENFEGCWHQATFAPEPEWYCSLCMNLLDPGSEAAANLANAMHWLLRQLQKDR